MTEHIVSYGGGQHGVCSCPIGEPHIADAEPEQTFRIEIRFDFTGTAEQARARAAQVARRYDHGAVTAIFDADWEEI